MMTQPLGAGRNSLALCVQICPKKIFRSSEAYILQQGLREDYILHQHLQIDYILQQGLQNDFFQHLQNDYFLQQGPQNDFFLHTVFKVKGHESSTHQISRDTQDMLIHTKYRTSMQDSRAILRLEYLQSFSEFQNFSQRVPPRNPSARLSGVRFTVLIWAGATRLKGTTHLYLNLTSPSWSNSGPSPILPIPFRSNFQR